MAFYYPVKFSVPFLCYSIRKYADAPRGQTATKNGVKRTVLFDTGPEEDVWERNVKRLKSDISQIELIVLSHWHRDHSGIYDVL